MSKASRKYKAEVHYDSGHPVPMKLRSLRFYRKWRRSVTRFVKHRNKQMRDAMSLPMYVFIKEAGLEDEAPKVLGRKEEVGP